MKAINKLFNHDSWFAHRRAKRYHAAYRRSRFAPSKMQWNTSCLEVKNSNHGYVGNLKIKQLNNYKKNYYNQNPNPYNLKF